MTLSVFAFDPVDGLRNATDFPDPAAPGILRAQVQTPSDQLKDYINGALKTEVDGKSDKYLTFATITASKIFALADIDVVQMCSHASVAINTTIPPQSDVAWPGGAFLPVKWDGVVQVAFVAGAGVTINPATKLKINAQGDYVGALRTAENVWDLIGPTKA